MKLFQALLENMDCSAFLDQIVGKLLAELHVATGKTGLKAAPTAYITSLLCTLSMCFSNNAALTFTLVSAESQTGPLFATWLSVMDSFKREPCLRRVIFGLCGILKLEPAALP